jgi:hypothetical protein
MPIISGNYPHSSFILYHTPAARCNLRAAEIPAANPSLALGNRKKRFGNNENSAKVSCGIAALG